MTTNNKKEKALEALEYIQNYIKGSAYKKYSWYEVLKQIIINLTPKQ